MTGYTRPKATTPLHLSARADAEGAFSCVQSPTRGRGLPPEEASLGDETILDTFFDEISGGIHPKRRAPSDKSPTVIPTAKYNGRDPMVRSTTRPRRPKTKMYVCTRLIIHMSRSPA